MRFSTRFTPANTILLFKGELLPPAENSIGTGAKFSRGQF